VLDAIGRAFQLEKSRSFPTIVCACCMWIASEERSLGRI